MGSHPRVMAGWKEIWELKSLRTSSSHSSGSATPGVKWWPGAGPLSGAGPAGWVRAGGFCHPHSPHNTLGGRISSEANHICPGWALLTCLLHGPWALTVETTSYSPSLPCGSWKEPRILRTQKPWRTSLSQSPLLCRGERCSSRAVFYCIFVISILNPFLLDSLAMDSVVIRVLGTKS